MNDLQRNNDVLDLYHILIITGVVIIFFWSLSRLFLLVTVLQNSMLPTFCPGDRALVIRYWPIRWLRRSQIVLVSNQGRSDIYIKRVVALPGDMYESFILECKDNSVNKVTRNWEVPDGHFFVCGDNPEASSDSRSWGALPFSSLYGLVFLRFTNDKINPDENLDVNL